MLSVIYAKYYLGLMLKVLDKGGSDCQWLALKLTTLQKQLRPSKVL